MTLDQIDRMVRQANPVPDPMILEAVEKSVLTKQRRMEMQTHDRVIVDEEGGKPRGRNLLIGIAAAAAIIIGALLLLRPTNDAPVADDQTVVTEAPSTASPVEVATAFLEAYAANDVDDVDQAASFLAPEALADFFGDLETMRLDVRLSGAQSFTRFIGVCEETNSTPSETQVRCPYDFHGIRSEAMGLGPYTGSYYDFIVQGGEIVSISDMIRFMDNGFNDEMWTPFFNWVAAAYPDDVAVMYSQPRPGSEANRTPESIALWEQRSREYVDVVSEGPEAVGIATSFMDALQSAGTEEAATYLTPKALTDFGGDVESMRVQDEWDQAIGSEVLLDSCTAMNVGPSGTLVRCTYATHGLRSGEIGMGPYSGNWFDLTVRDGEIEEVLAHYAFLTNGYSREMWEPFADWVAENYPDDASIMYANSSQTQPRLTEESIALWEQRSREYVTVVGG